jgi:hypothetical protein
VIGNQALVRPELRYVAAGALDPAGSSRPRALMTSIRGSMRRPSISAQWLTGLSHPHNQNRVRLTITRSR